MCLQCELFMLFKKNSARHKLNLFQLISNYYEFDPTDAIFKNIRQKSMFFFAKFCAIFRIVPHHTQQDLRIFAQFVQ